jgi:hypothetical protein
MNEQNINLAITLLLALTTKAGQISAGIAQARSEGRDLTDGELQALRGADDAQRGLLTDAIARAKADGM